MADADDPVPATPGSPPPVDAEMENLTPPRLMITKMELENFKSYAGIKPIGPFHKCFSAVVGPNGSGKSNVIDAMLFVFGKRAKQLRLNKVSELIHKSQDFPDCRFARVSVFFQEIIDTGSGDEDYELVQGTERVVTRVARKDNSSTYQMDGKNCQFKDVAKYLDSKGIDLDNNRFLILQGEVEMISMMPPKGKTENDEGLLEYLEDIIGSNKYLEETNEAAERVEVLTETRQEKLNRVKAVEKEKDSLEAAKLEAEALLGKEREIRSKQNVLYQLYGLQAKHEAEHFTSKKDTAVAQLEEERQQLQTANDRVTEIESGWQEQQRDHGQIHKELVRTKDEFAAYERRDIKLREEIKHEKAQKKELQAKIAKEEEKINDANRKREDATESIPSLEEDIETCKEAKRVADEKLELIDEETKEQTQVLRAELEAATQKLAPVTQERAVFQASLDTAETQANLLQNATRRAAEKLAKAESELANLDETKADKRAELETAQDELATAKQRIEQAGKEDKELELRETKIAQRNRQLQARAEGAKAALQSKANGRQNPAVQGILKAAAKGGELAKYGVLGRLGDLASIPEQYDVAVSTACGSLDHIVVHTTAGVQKCLQFLRKHSLGRANFIPLDKMKKGAHDRHVETPENAPRLFDLIQTPNVSLLPAIFLGVSDTLVAPDLETATRWAYESGNKRWRVVTMTGDLIEASGTMSGGGKRVKRGGMRLANRSKSQSVEDAQEDDEAESMDYENLQQEADKAQELMKQVRQARKALAEELRQLKKRIKQLELLIPKLEIEINGFATTRHNLTESIPELRAQSEMSASDAAKLDDLNAKVTRCKDDMASCAQLATELEAEVERLQKAILDAGGAKLKKQRKACEKSLKKLNEAEKALKTAHVAIVSSEKAAGKAATNKEAAEEKLLTCKQTLDEKKVEFKTLEVDAEKVHAAFERVKELEEEKRLALEAVTKEVEELKESQSKAKYVEIELAGKVDALDKQLQDASRKVDHWSNETDKLRAAAEEEGDFDESDDEDEESEGDVSMEQAVEGDVNDNASDKSGDVADETNDSGKDVSMDGTVENEENGRALDEPNDAAPVKLPKNALPTFSDSVLERYNKEAVKEEITMLETERNSIAKNANMGAIAEYRKKEADYLAKVSELDSVTEQRNKVRRQHEELRRARLDMFMDGFGRITLKLKEMYQMITLGGDAELELVDSLDPFSEGIVFSVRPPKKSWKNISNLSGGEKTLSSLALVFALHHYKPTPLYVMDEIDAALDFKNVSIVANYIKERTKNAQFIIISLRNNMFELADRLVGIYKTNNATKSVTINPRAFGLEAQQNGRTPSTPALAERTNKSGKRPLSAIKNTPTQRKMSFGDNEDEPLNA